MKTAKTMTCSLEKHSKSRFSFFKSITTQIIRIETITLILKTKNRKARGLKPVKAQSLEFL